MDANGDVHNYSDNSIIVVMMTMITMIRHTAVIIVITICMSLNPVSNP